jgi:glycosyltransferase involved in cell wall biosynthesis
VRGEFSAARLGARQLARDESLLVHAADKVVAVSDYAARDLASEYGIPVPPVVANGVDRARFRPGPVCVPASGYRVTLDGRGQPVSPTPISDLLSAHEPVAPWVTGAAGCRRLVWVGKITPMKGWDLLEAAVRALRGIAMVSVLLGHSRALVPVTVDSRHDVTVLQDLDDQDMPSFYRAADWLLSTSRWEGFGLAIAEALACGTPVLLPESLETARELLPAGGGRTYRDIKHLAAIVSQPDRAEGRLPRRYDWALNAAQTLDLYWTLISGQAPCEC